MRIALYQPDIAGNVGTILRLAACLGVPVDLIDRCAFPRPKACGDALTRSSIEQLHGLGLAVIADQAFRLGRSRFLGTVETPEAAAAAEVDKRSAVTPFPARRSMPSWSPQPATRGPTSRRPT